MSRREVWERGCSFPTWNILHVTPSPMLIHVSTTIRKYTRISTVGKERRSTPAKKFNKFVEKARRESLNSVSTKFNECYRLFCFLNFNFVDLIFQLFFFYKFLLGAEELTYIKYYRFVCRNSFP